MKGGKEIEFLMANKQNIWNIQTTKEKKKLSNRNSIESREMYNFYYRCFVLYQLQNMSIL